MSGEKWSFGERGALGRLLKRSLQKPPLRTSRKFGLVKAGNCFLTITLRGSFFQKAPPAYLLFGFYSIFEKSLYKFMIYRGERRFKIVFIDSDNYIELA